MANSPLIQSMMDMLSRFSLPAADAPIHENAALSDPQVALPEDLPGPHAVIDRLLAEVERDLLDGRLQAAITALGLAGTRVGLDAVRGVAPPRHVEWLAAHLRTAVTEMDESRPGKALKAVRLARLALR